MNRGLFGASARRGVAFAPELEGEGAMGLTDQQPRSAEVVTSTKEPAGPAARSYLKGLIKYQRPDGQSDAQRMALMGAMLSDVGQGLGGGHGGAVGRTQERFEAQGRQDRARSMMEELYGDDPQAQLMYDLDRSALTQAWLESKKAKKPRLIEGPDGIYAIDEEAGTSRRVQEYERRAPAGWEWDEAGGLRPIKNGPYDLEYIGQATGTRRAAVVRQPMPARGRSGGGGGVPKPPPNFVKRGAR
jgi:hypothetical protein